MKNAANLAARQLPKPSIDKCTGDKEKPKEPVGEKETSTEAPKTQDGRSDGEISHPPVPLVASRTETGREQRVTAGKGDDTAGKATRPIPGKGS